MGKQAHITKSLECDCLPVLFGTHILHNRCVCSNILCHAMVLSMVRLCPDNTQVGTVANDKLCHVTTQVWLNWVEAIKKWQIINKVKVGLIWIFLWQPLAYKTLLKESISASWSETISLCTRYTIIHFSSHEYYINSLLQFTSNYSYFCCLSTWDCDAVLNTM